MLKYLGLEPGSVSPFGLINDEEHHVILFLDKILLKFLAIRIGAITNDLRLKRNGIPAYVDRGQLLHQAAERHMHHVRLVNGEPLILLMSR